MVLLFLNYSYLINTIIYFDVDAAPIGYNSTAAQGNYLEAINLSFNGKYIKYLMYLKYIKILVCICLFFSRPSVPF